MRVLVADDNVAVRELLKRYLLSWQYDVIEAVDGMDAWQIMRNDPPDIAVLDWMMPGVDGLALCDQYNELSDVPFIYFILLTAKNEKADLIYALSHGVHDYQTKPVDKDELFGRLAVARRLIDAQRKAIHATRQVERFRQNVEHLEQLADERAKQLIHADRLISLGTLSAGMAHEISNALGYICDGAYELQYQLDHVQPLLRVAVETAAPNHKKDMTDFLVQCPSSVESIHEGINKVVNIVELNFPHFLPSANHAATPKTEAKIYFPASLSASG
ncbi:MAG: response regulator, partial [Spartobacteria bacterium]|nr:response regulator [Spartobacteria bacterium]